MALLGAGLLLGGGCNLVAGLGSFHPQGSGGSSSSITTANVGGNGGAADQGSTSESVGGGGTTTDTSSSQTTGGADCSPYVLISEVSTSDDFVELWNPTGTLFTLDGATLTARGGNNMDTKKWTGMASDSIDAGQYFVIGSTGMIPAPQGKLSSGLTNTAPTVVVLEDKDGNLIDSVCICPSAGCSYLFQDSTEICSHAVVSAEFFGPGKLSAQRVTCQDTDRGSDFAVGCETPGGPYSTTCPAQ